MRKAIVFKSLGIISLYSVYLVVGVHVLFADNLLFQSDPYNIAVYLGAAALAGMVVVLVIALPLLLISQQHRHTVYRSSALLLAAMIASTSCLLLLNSSGILQQSLQGAVGRIVISAVCFSPMFGAFFLPGSYRDEIVKRVELLGKATSIAIVFFVPIAVMSNHLVALAASRNHGDAGNHLLLIVVDGMPSQYLRAYNSEASPTDFDKIFKNGIVFTNMRTSVPYTYGFFGILYTGNPKFGASRGNSSRKHRTGNMERTTLFEIKDNLFHELQRKGVSTRWIVYHRNGIPEASGAQTNSYKGLRSYHLTNNTAWIPELLGVDYHVTIASRAFAERYIVGDVGRAVYDLLNKGTDGEYIKQDAEFVVDHISATQSAASSSFTLLHTSWGGFLTDIETEKRVEPQKSKYVSEPEAIQTFRQNNYRYPAVYESLVRDISRNNILRMSALSEQFQYFLERLKARMQKLPTIIVTADHGSIFDKGRIWYGYHPNEEVIRVPLVVLNGGSTGIDDRLFSTPDLTGSILDFFGAGGERYNRLSSFFRDNRGREYVASLTLSANKHSEWYLVILSRCDAKYQINLHPDGDGKIRLYNVDNYSEILVSQSTRVAEKVRDIVSNCLRQFGIRPGDVHRNFRSLCFVHDPALVSVETQTSF